MAEPRQGSKVGPGGELGRSGFEEVPESRQGSKIGREKISADQGSRIRARVRQGIIFEP